MFFFAILLPSGTKREIRKGQTVTIHAAGYGRVPRTESEAITPGMISLAGLAILPLKTVSSAHYWAFQVLQNDGLHRVPTE